jgi:hypothetical protein
MSAASEGGLWQRRALASIGVLMAIAFWTVNYGLIDLIDGFTGLVDQSRNQVLDVGWGALFGIVVPLGMLAQVRRPERNIAGLQQALAVVIALTVTATAAGEWRYFVLVASLSAILAILVSLHPARRSFFSRGGEIDVRLFLLAAIAAAPCFLYAAQMVESQRRNLPPLDAESNGLHHWTVMAALAVTALLLVVLAALGSAGRRVPAWSAALAAAAWAISVLLAPATAGGAVHAWAYVALAWAAAVVCAVET